MGLRANARHSTRQDMVQWKRHEGAERGWGKPAQFQPQDGDPLDLTDAEAAAEEFRAAVLRLAEREPDDTQ